MSQYRDLLPSQKSWIHELARSEVYPSAEKVLQLGASFDPQQLIEESTVDFLTELRQHFNEFTKIFNGYAEGGKKFHEVKVYSLSQGAADFLVFRNQVKLVISNVAHGMIQFSFEKHSRGTLAVDGQTQYEEEETSLGGTQDLVAKVGPFRDVYWTFQGEKVNPEQVARFYFAEFVRTTRENKSSRRGNEMLLEQFKSFLHEKGLDL